jgi:hypothetical protein
VLPIISKEQPMANAGPELPPPAQVMQLLMGKFVTQAISTVARLGIADQFKGGPRSADEIAKAVGTNGDATYRLLRALTMFGVFAEHPERRFTLTPLGECLRTDVPGSLARMAIFLGEGWHSAAWADFANTVRTGRSAFVTVHGAELFDWLAAHPKECGVFQDAMTSFSSVEGDAVAEAYDFGPFKKIADVAGGHGLVLSKVLKRAPQARGVLFDRPEVIAGARATIAAAGMTDRIELQGGDMFQTVPTGCDCYLVKHIIHDWDDAHCTTLLKHIREALPATGRLLVIDPVVPGIGEPSFAKLIDLEMLAVTHGGRERTAEEFGALLAGAGLKLARIVPTRSQLGIIEAVRA